MFTVQAKPYWHNNKVMQNNKKGETTMLKNPVYGLEKPYLELLQKELLVYTDDTAFDAFSNLIAEKKGEKTILVGFAVSENALLINEILPDGKVKYSPLFELPETVSNERVLSNNNKSAYIDAKNNTLDFGVCDEKSALRIVKPGDVLYLKAFVESFGDYYVTNEKAFFLKQILVEFIKQNSAKISVAFLREKNKGGYALGKNKPSDEAYFITCTEQLPDEVCFLKKEGDFVSPMDIPSLTTAVSKDSLTQANAYFLASGCEKVASLAIRCEKLPNGHFKIKKEAVKKLYAFLENLNR